MALNDLGIVRPGSTIIVPFHTFDSNDPSASVAIAAFVLADIGIYKGTSMTERGSTTGVVLLETDGIDLDSAVGIGGFSIDLSSNATADYYNVGDPYYVTVGPVTVDAAVVNFVSATFRIGYPGAIHETNIATLASQVSFTLDAGSADNDAYNGCVAYIHDIASAVQVCFGYVSDYVGSTKTVTLKADPGIFTIAAGDNISIFPPANVQAVAGTTQTAGDIAALVVTADAAIDVAVADLANATDGLGAIKAETALIVADTNELQTDNIPGTLSTIDNLVDDLESRLGTPSDFGSGTSTIAANLQDLADNGTAAFDRSTDSLQAIRDRGDSAWVTATGFALASVVGALNDAAAAGAVTETDTLMKYIKQLINILIGGPGVVTFPAEAAPGNGVSLAEVIRAIHADVTGLNGAAMRGTDSANTTTPPTVGAIADAVLDEATSGHTTAGSLSKAIIDTLADTNELQVDDYPTSIAAIQTVVDALDTLSKAAGPGDLAAVKTAADAIKVVTDKFAFTVANQVNANIKSTNDLTITGAGTTGDPFGVD